MKGQPVPGSKAWNALLQFRFPSLKVVPAVVVVANGFNGDLIRPAIVVRGLQKRIRELRMREFDISTVSPEDGLGGQTAGHARFRK